jgi:hypothetical protein
MPGPAPKRDAERTRTPDPKSGVARHGELRPVKIPPVDQSWHKRAKELYKALKTSGQADYFQDSDWAYARILCDYLTRWYSGKGGAMDGANIETMMSKLGMTEGARRQTLRIELDLPEDERPDAELLAISGYESMLKKKAQ